MARGKIKKGTNRQATAEADVPAALSPMAITSIRDIEEADGSRPRWHHGWIVHEREVCNFEQCADPDGPPLSEAQWKAADKLLKQGFALAYSACCDEALAALIEATKRFTVPFLAVFNVDDEILYLAKAKGRKK